FILITSIIILVLLLFCVLFNKKSLNALNTIMNFLAEQESGSSSGLCFSLRENDERRQLLCNDRRSKFNFNPFGLRFGKRYIYRRAVARARTNKFSPLSVFSRELEVAT
uniref:Kisspeptin 2 n=1 Tax=Cynoglossus semilaevis TaxID=244447 RepID=A0A3P8VBT5_CYNSE